MSEKPKHVMSNEQNEVLIRNKFRNRNPEPKFTAYQPEYERLGLEPKVHAVNPTDFMTNKKRSSTATPSRMVQSGQNKELVWTDSLNSSNNSSEEIDYEDIELPPQNYLNPTTAEETADDLEGQDLGNQNNQFSLSNLEPGSYVLLCGDEIVEVGNKEQIESAIEHLLLTEENSELFYNKLCVLKRIEICTGVFING